MTLIDSLEFRNLTNTIGTILFAITILWIFWFASRMD